MAICFHINLISHDSRFLYSFLKRAPHSNVCISRNITYQVHITTIVNLELCFFNEKCKIFGHLTGIATNHL